MKSKQKNNVLMESTLKMKFLTQKKDQKSTKLKFKLYNKNFKNQKLKKLNYKNKQKKFL